MAFTTSYSAMVDEIASFIEDRTAEFDAEVPSIIARGSDMVQMALDLDIWRTTVLDNLPFSNRLRPRPDGLKVRSIFLMAEGEFLLKRSYDYCRAYSGAGTPRFWAEHSAAQLYIAPTPDQNYTAEFEMLGRLPKLSVDNQTNWLTDNVADLLLLACLIEAEQFLQAPDRVQQLRQDFLSKVELTLGTLSDQERPTYSPVRATPERLRG